LQRPFSGSNNSCCLQARMPVRLLCQLQVEAAANMQAMLCRHYKVSRAGSQHQQQATAPLHQLPLMHWTVKQNSSSTCSSPSTTASSRSSRRNLATSTNSSNTAEEPSRWGHLTKPRIGSTQHPQCCLLEPCQEQMKQKQPNTSICLACCGDCGQPPPLIALTKFVHISCS